VGDGSAFDLNDEECWARLRAARHGVLATLHPERGVDVVPVVFVVDGAQIVIPIDNVKPKSTTRLRRLVNIAADPKVAVLVEHYDDDWTQLWWVRAHGHAAEAEPTADWAEALAAKYPQYQAPHSVASVIVVTVERLTGWP
jgi:PPOX class probable F420-dependent enzyme